MTLDRTKISLDTVNTAPSVAWENAFVTPINNLLNNVVEVDFTKNIIHGFRFTYLSDTKKLKIGSGKCVDPNSYELIETFSDYELSVPGSIDTGSVANNTWYYVWVVKNELSNLVKFILSTSDTTPKVPGGYSSKRMIGSVYTTTSTGDIRTYVQVGTDNQRDYFLLDASSMLVTTSLTNNVYSNLTMTVNVPNSVYSRLAYVQAQLRQTTTSTNRATSKLSIRHGDSSSTVGSYEAMMKCVSSGREAWGDTSITGLVKCNSSNQIAYALRNHSSGGTPELTIFSTGYRMIL